MEEKWKKIENYPLYEVSTLGRVRNRKTLRILNQSFQQSGNAIVCLSSEGRIKTYSVSKLMLETFKPVEGMERMAVRYIDGNKANNVLDNLDWTKQRHYYDMTPKEVKELKMMAREAVDTAIRVWFEKYLGTKDGELEEEDS